jgi:NAD(P)-dependent dehydrogenase (short-subunit alcohol dehydrogenase family)
MDMSRPKTAVVVGATNGIGKAIACRLAQEGFQVIAVGRDGPGRSDAVVKYLNDCTTLSSSSTVKHEFRPCDAFDLGQVKSCASDIVRDNNGGIDALVMTQGMATIQGYTPTINGNDQKLTLHFWSRAAFAYCLLPALCNSTMMPGGPIVLSVLSGGVHSSYSKYNTDPELKNNYSIANAATFAGYYTDLFFDNLASKPSNESINFIHAAPGFVATAWGTEMPSYLRVPIRAMQKLLGKSSSKCAEYMVSPILQCATGNIELKLPPANGGKEETAGRKGLYIMNENGTSGKLTKGHTEEALESVWSTTKDVLGRVGIELND